MNPAPRKPFARTAKARVKKGSAVGKSKGASTLPHSIPSPKNFRPPWLDAVMQGERPFDFFISYNTLDREHATRVADVLEAAGYRVFLDYRCIPAAFDWAVLLGWGIQAAQRLLPIVSRNFTQSAFASAEWSSFFAQDPAGLNGLILPAFIEDFPLPHFLRTRKGPQLYRYKPANWRKHILAALQ